MSTTARWVTVARVSELPEGLSKIVRLDDQAFAVFHLADGWYAIEDVCTHDGGELAGGCVIGDEIECVRHGARFNIRTGAVTAPPAYEPVAKFPVRIENGAVQVRDDRWD